MALEAHTYLVPARTSTVITTRRVLIEHPKRGAPLTQSMNFTYITGKDAQPNE